MQVARKSIESSLPKKGFVQEVAHHRYFYHEYAGKRTGAYTYTSHGSDYKSYGAELLKQMKTQLRLDSVQQVVALCNCPMSGDAYNAHLRAKGLVLDAPTRPPKPKSKA